MDSSHAPRDCHGQKCGAVASTPVLLPQFLAVSDVPVTLVGLLHLAVLWKPKCVVEGDLDPSAASRDAKRHPPRDTKCPVTLTSWALVDTASPPGLSLHLQNDSPVLEVC